MAVHGCICAWVHGCQGCKQMRVTYRGCRRHWGPTTWGSYQWRQWPAAYQTGSARTTQPWSGLRKDRKHIVRVGQNHTFIGIYGVYTVFLAGKSPCIRSYMVCIYDSGQPYTLLMFWGWFAARHVQRILEWPAEGQHPLSIFWGWFAARHVQRTGLRKDRTTHPRCS